MRSGEKGLERKEMRVQKGKTVHQFPAEKEIAMAKKWRKGWGGEISVPPGEQWLPEGESAETSDLSRKLCEAGAGHLTVVRSAGSSVTRWAVKPRRF
jgi:hypothetical protein